MIATCGKCVQISRFIQFFKCNISTDSEKTLRKWLFERYADVKDKLIDLTLHDDVSVQELALRTLMIFVKEEGQHPVSSTSDSASWLPLSLLQVTSWYLFSNHFFVIVKLCS